MERGLGQEHVAKLLNCFLKTVHSSLGTVGVRLQCRALSLFLPRQRKLLPDSILSSIKLGENLDMEIKKKN